MTLGLMRVAVKATLWTMDGGDMAECHRMGMTVGTCLVEVVVWHMKGYMVFALLVGGCGQSEKGDGFWVEIVLFAGVHSSGNSSL